MEGDRQGHVHGRIFNGELAGVDISMFKSKFHFKNLLYEMYWTKYGSRGLSTQNLKPLFASVPDGRAADILDAVKNAVVDMGEVFGHHIEASRNSTTFQLILFLTVTENSQGD